MNEGRYLPLIVNDPLMGGRLVVRRHIPTHLARALHNLKRPGLKRRVRRKWENVRDRFRHHHLHPDNDIRLTLTVEPITQQRKFGGLILRENSRILLRGSLEPGDIIDPTVLSEAEFTGQIEDPS